ncbi:hypothetical protein [Pedobacter sp. HMWF019]|uniref:hypothetical protein n=1 Tax=Pedobacter sp. HMWF019 TaxID=2056856 RepID=UPI0011B1CE15|nr:hypothetical protein [Pedobacter sp. HMWF019]
MVKTRVFSLLICFFSSIGLVCILFISSSYLNNSPNSFIRRLPSHAAVGIGFLSLDPSSFYFVGNDQNLVYLGNRGIFNQVISVDLESKQTQLLTVKAPDSLHVFNDVQLRIDSGRVFLLEGMKSQVWVGSLEDLKVMDKVNTPGFIAALTLDNGSLILKSTKNGEGVLLKQDHTSGQLKIGKDLLQKQVDGFFCTDGNLVKVPNSNKIFYTYYYRNQFICADTNLNLLYRGKTIDTVAHAKIKVARIKSSNQITLSAPPVYVNKQSTANEKYLFIHSALKADNETADMHEQGAAIDVYNVSDGKYKLSFYLSDFNGKKLTDFRVYGQSLYALYDHYLYKYQLNF